MKLPIAQNLLAATLVWAAVVATSPLSAAPVMDDQLAISGVLLLHNGNMLRGKISRTADHYRVTLPRGELQIRVEQVEMFCKNFDEAYRRRRAARGGSTADTHADLAAWCLRHNLLEYASRELLEAKEIDSNHRRLTQLERQLRQAIDLNARTSLVEKKSGRHPTERFRNGLKQTAINEPTSQQPRKLSRRTPSPEKRRAVPAGYLAHDPFDPTEFNHQTEQAATSTADP